ncbi:MAG TPA: hypothetical protein VGR26_01490 [Acidimicrobiales bacterium]|nr:hypothetical protein [Acidimicrobiales bacterium]
MSATDTAPVQQDPSPPSPAPPPAPSEWRVARAVGRVEARHLLTVALVPAALGALMSVGYGGDLIDLRSVSFNAAFNLLLLAAVTLVASHRAVTRARRDGSEELLGATPAPARARTAGHLLAVLAPTALGAAVTGFSSAALFRQTATVGDPVLSELAVGPVLVAGAGCLGVLLARVWPQPFTPYLACLAIAVAELGVNTPVFADSGLRWLVFWVEGTLWWLLPRHSGPHLAYLLGLVAMAVVGALARHGVTRRLAAAAVVAVAVTVVAAGVQMRQPQEEWRAANAMFAAPESVQTCWSRKGVRYCAFPRFEEVMEHVSQAVASVRAVTPEEAWPSGLAVTQRVTAVDLEYAGAAADALSHVVDMPRGRVRQPDDGELHPALEFGWSTVQELGFGVQLGAKAVGLPVVPEPRTGEVCLATNQARAVVALWLGGHATDDAGAGLAWLVERASEAAAARGGAVHDAVFPIAEVDVYGGFVVSLDDARLALELLRRDSTEVAARLAEHWDVASRPTTTSAELARLAGVPVPVGGAPRAPFVAHMDPDLVRLGAPCR